MLNLVIALFVTAAFPLQALAQTYTPQAAIADVLNEPLRFMGRDYIDPSLTGGNLSCLYKNSRVFVLHNGCRPTAAHPLTAFDARIISRDGGQVRIYIENNRTNYTLQDAGPGQDSLWRVEYKATPSIESEPNFRVLMDMVSDWMNSFNMNACWVINGFHCSQEIVDGAEDFETFWEDPHANRLREVHDAILRAPRI